MKLFAIDGNTQRLDGGAMYGNAPRSLWEAWSPPDDRHRISLACRALLVVTDDGRSILFEAGIGAFFDPKLKDRYGVLEDEHILAKNLAAVGHPHETIDAVVLSHLHFDHAGGLLAAYDGGEPKLLFPKAKFYVGEGHWARAKQPHSRDRASFVPALNDLLARSGRLVLVGPDGLSDLAPLVHFRFSDGHTMGLMVSEIATPHGPLAFVADLIPGMPWVHLPITMGYDRFPELLVDEKRALLESLVARGGSLFFTHDPKEPCGVVKQDARGRFSAEATPVSSLA